MLYNFNGKSINIPDAEIKTLMASLDLTEKEAIETWLDDNDYTVNETVEALTEKAKSIRRYEKSENKRKPSTRERKVDEEKKRLLDDVRVLVEGLGGNVTAINNEADFTFLFNNNEYTFKLIKHRKKKE